MIDNGFPLTTEPNILREMIAPPNIVSKVLSVVTGNSSNVKNTLPDATASSVPWRTTDLKHTNNDVYVDLVEEMDAIINRDGALVKCEIYGEVQVNSHLSGLPDLTLSFANPSILNDVRFHPCVRFRPWESDQILSFVPPDGEFKLMSYRVKNLKNYPLYVKPQITSDSGTCRVSVLVGLRNDPGKTIDSITVQFQLPSCILSADLTSNHGIVNILANKTCSWSIGRIPKDKAPSMSGTLVLETGLERLHVFPTFQVSFRIMGVALSGLQIDKLDMKNLPTRPYKGFRALTRAGEFEVREALGPLYKNHKPGSSDPPHLNPPIASPNSPSDFSATPTHHLSYLHHHLLSSNPATILNRSPTSLPSAATPSLVFLLTATTAAATIPVYAKRHHCCQLCWEEEW
ncbi:AP-3 complex subunit mu [Sarracenia purpurea var. burkii]